MELLLLVCLCLLSCSGDAVRVVVEEDSDAVLPCSLSTEEDISGKLFDWKKDGQKEVFMYDAGVHYNNGRPGQDEQFKGRVSFYQDQLQNGDASIKITRTKMADSGTYSCDFPHRPWIQTSFIELVVGAAPKPVISILAVTKDWVLLQCEARGVPPLTVELKDGAGNILNSESTPTSETGSPSSITLNITVTKTDDYSCVATQKQFSHQVTAVIPVYIQGAASEPYVTTVKTADGMVLQCKVLGAFPKPKVDWKDRSGNVLPVKVLRETESGGLYDIVLRAAVTKTDTFRCVVTQEEIGHEIEAKIDVVKVPPPEPGWSAGAIVVVTLVITLLVVGLPLFVLLKKGFITLNCSRRNRANGPPRTSEQPLSSSNLAE
ncbi:butyrophilin subfamily 2 member A1-like isoform X3 [Acanthopagrus latus]|uniref:butyrophilin subfamily 2 member A1-like isoform X3 n=1 Tax=Acanthopagrus latus TaxID=8177 RepID=UPI00187D0726|nr:butyrophilin subfamily 2 member A1-like isoform X3 [Acanthopagrus latus]